MRTLKNQALIRSPKRRGYRTEPRWSCESDYRECRQVARYAIQRPPCQNRLLLDLEADLGVSRLPVMHRYLMLMLMARWRV